MVIKVAWPGAPEYRDPEPRLRREAEALQRLAGSEDARLVEVGMIDNRSYLISQYVEGRTLAQEVEDQGPLT